MRVQRGRGLLRRAAVVGAAAGLVLASGVGVAAAASGPALTWSPTSAGGYTYTPLTPGATASQTFTLTNTGSTASAALTVTLAGSGFTKTADSCTGTSLGPAKSCQVTVRYAPTGYGQSDTATLTAAGVKTAATASLTLHGTSVKATPTVATTPGAGGTVGTATVTDTAVVSGGSTPSGTMTFTLYGPSPTASCSSAPVDTETATVAGDGSYTTPSGAAPSTAGTYWWLAAYSGDTHNSAAGSRCGDESVVLGQASPTITTTPGAGGTVGATTLADTATLTGGFHPGGTVTFSLYAGAACTGPAVFTSTRPVTGAGTVTSDGFSQATTAGGYEWTAAYSGDTNNTPATSGCGDEAVTVQPATPTISTTPSAGGTAGASTLTDTATLTGGYNPTGTVTFALYPGAACTGTPLLTSTQPVTAAGTATSDGYSVSTAGDYEWTAAYSGDTNNAPAASGCGDEAVTVHPATPTIATTPSAGGTVGGSTLTDTATLTGASSPTGTVTFSLYAGAACTGTPVFTSTEPVTADGTATSDGYAGAAAGGYEWTAAYSGDTNNTPAANGCGDEAVTVHPAFTALFTHPLGDGQTVGHAVLLDTAVLAGGYHPTGTVTFRLYAGSACTGTPVFTSTKSVTASNNTYSDTYFTPDAGGYEWTAAYSGDSNNIPATSVCGAEPVTVDRASPTVSTTATPVSGAPGATLTDTAALAGGYNPSGTVTFSLYAGAACTGTPVFTSTQPVTGTTTTTSDGYGGAVAGSYEWTAAYSGDRNNAPATTACGAEPVGLLSAPKLLSPADGSVFNFYPRTETYTWQAVPGATSYIYQWLYCQPGGFTSCQPYPGADKIAVTGTSFTWDFIGGQPGEWRVIPVTANGIQGPPSAWWKFTWTV